ncbi:MAG: amino acid adenylation domain-containing protein, partial [Cyanobacteria bacterium P01_A01_bin.83]
ISKTRQTLFEALDYQELPFPLLVEKLQPERDPSRSPLFQAALVWDRSRKGEDKSAETARNDLILDYVAMEQRGAEFDILLTLFDSGESLSGTWRYNTDLFDATTIERMAGNFKTLLEGIVADPERPITELPILTKAEEHQLLIEWNKTQADYPQDKCIHQLFEAQVAKTPDAVAVVFESQQLTYRELNTRANQLAHYLQTQGVKPETLVAICVERSHLMVIGLLAILKAGGAYVPLDPNYPTERLADILLDSQAPILLTQQELTTKLPQSSTQIICLDDERKTLDQEQENPVSDIRPNNLAYIIYTSGSTGKPKGVQIEHCSAVNLLNSIAKQPGLTAADTVLAVTTISFDVAVPEIFLPLAVGAKVVVASSAATTDGRQLLELLNTYQATFMHPTPVTWRLLLAADWQGSPNLKMVSTGEALPKELAAQLLPKGAELWNLYGPTEITVWATGYKIEAANQPILIGRPLSNTQAYILDSQQQPVPIGVPGELHIGGAGVARGYLNRPELTAEKFIWQEKLNTRLYKTGDLVRYLPDGNIECLGRIDNQVKVRGFRIELEEIESTLTQHSNVLEAVIIVREDVPGNQQLVAYIVCKSPQFPTASSLRGFLKSTLPNYMIPAAFITLSAMPLTANGKINRHALPKPDPTKIELDKTFVAPSNQTEQQIAHIWSQVLNLKQIGIHDNFFELGGHSLLATKVFSRLYTTFQIELSLNALFEFPTVAELAEQIELINWSMSEHNTTSDYTDIEREEFEF